MLSRPNASKEKLKRKLDRQPKQHVLLRRLQRMPSESVRKQKRPQNFKGKLKKKLSRRD